MFFLRSDAKPQGPIYDWLLTNKQQILAGTADYHGTPVTETTEFYQYKYVVSTGAFTIILSTPHYLPTAENGYLQRAHWKYALISLLLGWWSIPWGPFFTIEALSFTLGSRRRRTASSLLQLAEYGWDAPHDATVNAHRKKILEISDAAAAEIRARMSKGGFSEDLAVRIAPGPWADTEVEIAFDYPVSDGLDWIDESQGLMLLIDKNNEFRLSGRRVDFHEGKFFAAIAGARGQL